jgi:hypothetical protein
MAHETAVDLFVRTLHVKSLVRPASLPFSLLFGRRRHAPRVQACRSPLVHGAHSPDRFEAEGIETMRCPREYHGRPINWSAKSVNEALHECVMRTIPRGWRR